MVTEKEHARLKEILKDADNCPRLTPWEINFCNCMWQKINRSRNFNITDKQSDVIDAIEKKVYAT
jgi:hypothetical protein